MAKTNCLDERIEVFSVFASQVPRTDDSSDQHSLLNTSSLRNYLYLVSVGRPRIHGARTKPAINALCATQ